MVNHGKSNGCLTCRQRRVKCDEGRPSCARCTTHGVPCGGYGKKPLTIRFKTQRIKSGAAGEGASADTPLLAQPHEDDETVATNFFINGFAIGGRSLTTSRGFFESIVPILNVAGATSAVRTATTAVSALLLNRWRRSSNTVDLSRVRLGQALKKLQADLQEPIKRRHEATLLSILMLQCYENAQATLQWDKPKTVHQDGAFTLIKSLGLESFQSEYAKRLLLYLLNADVNAALREARSVDPDMKRWAENTAGIPFNMSSQLDLNAIRLTEVQESFAKVQAVEGQMNTALLGRLIEVLDAFELWTNGVPKLWHPLRFQAQQQPDPPVEMYNNICEIYPSIEIATIWNTWRIYSLIAHDLRIQMVERLHGPRSATAGISEQEPSSDYAQTLVNSICYSIPFYLGNRSKTSAVENLSPSPVVFPSYHTLHHFGVESAAVPTPAEIMTAEAFQSNAKTQGAWQLSSVLRLLVFTLSKPTSCSLRTALRQGQLQWIEQQVLRVSRIFGVNEVKTVDTIDWTR